MVKIPHLPDFSHFVDKGHPNPVKVHNNVNLLIGEKVIVVNGIVISQCSEQLLNLVSTSSDVYLDDFVDDLEGVYDCLNLLYGGTVVISNRNIQTIIKFSVKFGIDKMYQICIDWIIDNVCEDNLYLVILTGLMVQQMHTCGNREILKICTDLIAGHVQNDLFELSRNWSSTDHGLVRFLLQAEIMAFTLPVITAWVETDGDIRLILDELETKEGTTVELAKNKENTSKLMKTMNEKVESLKMSKRISSVLSNSLLEVSGFEDRHNMSSCKDLTHVTSEGYTSWSLEYLIGLKTDLKYQLNYFEFCEVVLHWIAENTPSVDQATKLWCLMNRPKHQFDYLKVLRNTIVNCVSNGSLITEVRYKKFSCPYSNKFWFLTGYCGSIVNVTDDLLKKRTVSLSIECKDCQKHSSVCLRFDDKVPTKVVNVSSTHVVVKHWYMEVYAAGWNVFSFITNSLEAISARIRKSEKDKTTIILRCVYQCEKKK